jgi:hypothetical protein
MPFSASPAHSDVRLRPRPLAQAIQAHCPTPAAQSGFGLLSLIVGLALSAAVVGVAYTAYRVNQQQSEVATATQNTRDLQQAVLSSYASAANFNGLSTQSAIAAGGVPKNLIQGSSIVNPWGGTVVIAPVNIAGAAGPGNNNGYALTFDQVPSSECANFALHGGQGFYAVNVNSTSAMNGAQVSVPTASSLCNKSANTVQFIQAKSSPNAPGQPGLTVCVPPPPASQQVACPSGQLSSVPPYSVNGVTQTNYSFCNSEYGSPGTTPWTPSANTCVPACVAPASSTGTESQTGTCPAGQVTSTGATSFPQTATDTITYACPLPIGGYTTTPGPFGPWSPAVGTVCAPQCIAPPATTGSQTVTVSCPAGQVTSSGATSFSATETRSVTYSCPAPQGSYITTYGSWSAPSPAASSVCAPKCVAPATTSSPNYQWVNANPGCPSGQTGTYSYQYQQVQTITTTYSCPAPQGGYTSSTSAGGWSNTGATQNVTNTCAPIPPPASPPTASASGCTATGIPGSTISSTAWSLTWSYGTTVQKSCTCQVTLTNNGVSQGVSLTASSSSHGGGTYYGYSSNTYSVGGGTFTVGVMINASPSTSGGNSYWASTCQVSVALPNGGAEP